MRGKYWGQCCPNSRHGPPSRLLPGGHREWGHHGGGVFWKPYQEKELCDRPSYLRACGRTYSCFFPGCELSRPEPLILNNRLPVCLKKSSWGEKKKKKPSTFLVLLFHSWNKYFLGAYCVPAWSWCSQYNLLKGPRPLPSGSLP